VPRNRKVETEADAAGDVRRRSAIGDGSGDCGLARLPAVLVVDRTTICMNTVGRAAIRWLVLFRRSFFVVVWHIIGPPFVPKCHHFVLGLTKRFTFHAIQKSACRKFHCIGIGERPSVDRTEQLPDGRQTGSKPFSSVTRQHRFACLGRALGEGAPARLSFIPADVNQ